MSAPKSRGFIKYFLFLFVFIVSFCLLNIQQVELFGLAMFLTTNILFFASVGKDLTDGSITPDGKSTEWYIKFGTLIVSITFSFVSSIMMIMTIVTLQKKFTENDAILQWSPTDRKKLDDTKIIFTAVTTFIGVTALYVYFQPEDIRKFTYYIFDKVLNGPPGNWLRVLFPIVIIGLGSALYGQLERNPFEVNKTPKRVICDPKNNKSIKTFKESFVKSFWFLFAFTVIVLSRPFLEANFDVFGIFPSKIIGFSEEDRTLIYGQNPSIRLISLLTLGISNLAGLNKKLQDRIDNEKLDKGNGNSVLVEFASILMMPVLRWDVMYLLAKYAFGLTGLVYAGFSIREFDLIPKDDSCLFKNAHIHQLYIAFIVFLIIFYTFNTLTTSMLTSLVTNIMRFLVPPTVIALSSYLVFITDYFSRIAPNLVIQ